MHLRNSFAIIALLLFFCSVPAFAIERSTIPESAKHVLAAPVVEGWYFRAISGYPAAVTFEPVVLFKNGEYWETGAETLETLNVSADKAKHPRAWGTWKKQGATYWLTDKQGKSHDYKLGEGNWFPAYAYTGSIKLKPACERSSGGDYGNGLNSLTISKINFIDATHFTEGTNGGVMTGNASAWKKSGKAGTYRIYGHTIEFTYQDGKKVKTSFALGAEGPPMKPVNTLIFIGGYAYTDVD